MRSPLTTTLALTALLVGTPAALMIRFSNAMLPLQATDALLAIAALAWIVVGKAIIDRDATIDSTANHRLSPTWQARELVEQSLIGVGFVRTAAKSEEPPSLHRVAPAAESIDDLLPPHSTLGQYERVHRDDEAGPRRSVPLVHVEEPVDPPIAAGEVYVVGRGDTFWSVAEAALGDGRRWTDVQRLNLGRQVTAEHALTEDDELRIGWSIVLPLILPADDEINA